MSEPAAAATATADSRRPEPSEPRPASAWAWRWPGPVEPTGLGSLAAAAGAGLVTAVVVPLDRPGLGWVIAAAAAAGAIATGVRRPSAGAGASVVAGVTTDAPARPWERLAWALVTLALLAVGAVRAAEWLFGLCLLAAAATTVLALTGGRTVRGLVLGAVLLPVAVGRAATGSRPGVATLHRRVRARMRVGSTVAVTGLLLLGFGALLASADAAFSTLLGHALPAIGPATVLRTVLLFTAAAALALAGVVLLATPPAVDRADPAPAAGRVRTAEWAIPVGALVMLFASFVAVQLTVLFGGARYVLEPDGPSYAQHARGGFWQLLTVTVLTLLVIGVAGSVAPRRRPAQRWLLRGLVGALALLTLVIVASALFRMHTYQQAYGFSRLRVLVSVVELWLGLVFLLVIAATVRLRAGWLPRAVVATGVAAVLALAALNPDQFIAERNIDRWATGGHQLDLGYLAGLSADAAPALACLPVPHRTVALARIEADLADPPDDWRSANLSRAAARKAVRSEACSGRESWHSRFAGSTSASTPRSRSPE
ncbi:MAG: DUF4173 domain-containing protein [Micromonosporaceae bacterium]|nr:DUF4173 domain-containing protein [Micromonosporaceae bacterium]